MDKHIDIPIPANNPTEIIDVPPGVALPVWVLIVLVISRELGLGNLLKSVQEGRAKSFASSSDLTEKVVTQVLEEHGKLTSAVERLTGKVEQLTEELKESSQESSDTNAFLKQTLALLTEKANIC